jgi:uncharacterized membrane protein
MSCGYLAFVSISNRDWAIPAVVAIVLMVALAVGSYRHAPVDGPRRWAGLLLRMLGVLALLVCLLEPVWVGERAKKGANYFAVLVDNSRGMELKDPGASESRGAQLRGLLEPTSDGWLPFLEEEFQLRRYYFDSRLQATRDFSELSFEGNASALGAALNGLRERFEGQPLAGVLVLSDGNATDTVDIEAGMPPVYPVLIGAESSIRDAGIQSVSVAQTAFEDAPVTVSVRVNATGYAGRPLKVQLRAPDGAVVEEQTVRVPAGEESVACRFQVRPERNGILLYRARVLAENHEPVSEADSVEATLANNERWVVVDRTGGPYRVLYVAGRPNWEFKFLNRGLKEDEQVDVVGLIRVARREPRFEFRGREGESSNPLFRGFDRTTEETERYDQPVLVRFNPRDPAELAGGFPKDAATLFAYDAVILDDLEAGFFTHDQLNLLQRFVSERGGGFLLLGGTESFRDGGYERTPVGSMLPVYLDREPPQPAGTEFRLELTREGGLEPWLRLRTSEAGEQARLDELPTVKVLNRAQDLKPGASLLAVVKDRNGQPYPALAVQRFGLGRVGALLSGDLWRLGLRNEAMQADLQKWWRQWIRWLVADAPSRVALEATAGTDDAGAVRLQVRVRDAEYLPLDDASVTVTVKHLTNAASASLTGNAIESAPVVLRLNAEPSGSEAGLYETIYVPRADGAYVAQASVVNAEGLSVGDAETGWTSDFSADEFKSLAADRALMTRLAQATGGRLLRPGDLGSFVHEIPHQPAPITERVSEPLWHRSAVFLFALGCFVAEWGLRRRKGLA